VQGGTHPCFTNEQNFLDSVCQGLCSLLVLVITLKPNTMVLETGGQGVHFAAGNHYGRRPWHRLGHRKRHA
jgi:hypothetical protein